MRKTIIPILFFITLAIVATIVPVAALTYTGLTLRPGYVVVVDNFYVPPHPAWWSPGATNTGSQLAFKDSDGVMYVVKGYSWKNPLPPWDAHSYIVLIKQSWPFDSELGKVEVSPNRNYRVKAYFSGSSVIVVYGDPIVGSERTLGSFTPSGSSLDVYSEACTPRLEREIVQIPGTPSVVSTSEFLIFAGLGVIVLIAIVAYRRR